MPLTKKFIFTEDIQFGKILSELINIDTITDIELRCGEVWLVDIKKGRYKYNLEDRPEEERKELDIVLEKLPRQIAIRMEEKYNEGNPIIDGECVYKDEGQLRINAIYNSLTGTDYPGIAIRKTTYGLRIDDDNIFDNDYVTKDFLNLMEVVLGSGCNVMITGLTGSGKTELLKYLARYIKKNEAIITIEDTFEAYLKRIYPEKEVLALKSSEKQTFSHLIRACLRQNPDWIMVSETRGEEVKDLMDAVGTGHHLISTIHSDSAINIPYRMVDMAKVDGYEATRMFRQIHQNINIGVYIHYYNDDDGSHRQVTEVSEFYTDPNGDPKSHLIYRFDYDKNKFVSECIVGEQTINKIKRCKIDTSKIKGIFLDAPTDKYAITLENIKQKLNESKDFDTALSVVLNALIDAVNAQTGTFWYLSKENDIIFPLKTNEGEDNLKGIMLLPGDGIAGNVIETGISTIIKDCSSDDRWDKSVDEKTGFKTNTMMAVPFKFNDKAYGCFEILNRKSDALFDDDDLNLLENLSNDLSRLFEHKKEQLINSLEEKCGFLILENKGD